MARSAKRTVVKPFSYRDDPAVPDFPDDRPIIIFDGHCVLSSNWAQFLIRHAPKKRFKLLAAQSPLGQVIYEHYGFDPIDYQTNILIADGKAWFKSATSIRMLEGLGRPWSWISIARILPVFVCDPIYDLIARNRFSMFGRRNECSAPTLDIKDRFL